MSQLNRKEKYVIVSPKRTSGGAERVSALLASELAEQGFDVHYIQYFVSEQDYDISDKVNLHILYVKSTNALVRKIKRCVYTIKYVRSINADFVLPFLGKVVDLCFWATRFKRNSKCITTIRINPAVAPASRLRRWYRNIICFLSEGVFVQNEEQKRYFPKFMQKRVFAIPNPISESILQQTKFCGGTIKRIVTAGRLTDQKNQKMLIDSFADIEKVYPDIKLVIFGQGPKKEQLKQLVESYGLQDKISLPGRVDCIQDYYECGDVFVLPSNYEGMPNALMEAMAMGMPCISTNCPTGPSDLIVDGVNGYLVPCDDKNKLTEAICCVLNNASLADEMGKTARETMCNNFAVSKIVHNLVLECRKLGVK